MRAVAVVCRVLADRWRSAARSAVPAALAGALAACAAPGSEIHLEPLFARYTTADGAREIEALGGLFHRRVGAPNVWEDDPGQEGDYTYLTLGPLYSSDERPDGDWASHFLVPLGFTSARDGEGLSFLVPVYIWTREELPDGSGSEWKLAALPGLLMRSLNGRTEVGFFPFLGRFEDLVTFDRVIFVLWPLFVYAERNGSVSYHILYPIFGWTYGGGESSFHVFPLFGRARIEDRYDRTYLLWPFFHFGRDHMGGGGEEEEVTWWLFPLIGRRQRGTFEAYTWLWPFFGYSHDSRSGFWALDFPWFFVRIQRGPDDEFRTRFWPLYSHSYADGLESWNFLWPFVHVRREEVGNMRRTSTYVIPIWQSWDRVETASGPPRNELASSASWRKLVPLFQYERRDDPAEGRGRWERGSFPTLDPLPRNSIMDRHFAWMWKLWEWEQDARMRRERAWAGLWRRERDAVEERTSIGGLWARRRYVDDGERVRETSLLFGLIRWRTSEDEGTDLLPIAFPGPGWPAERAGAASGAPRPGPGAPAPPPASGLQPSALPADVPDP